MMSEAIEKRSGHFRIAKDTGPFAEREIGGDDDRRAFIEAADQMEEQLPASLGERKIAEFIENDEVHASEVIGHPPLPVLTGLGFETIDEIDDVEEASAGAAADTGAGDCDGQMGFAWRRWMTCLRKARVN